MTAHFFCGLSTLLPVDAAGVALRTRPCAHGLGVEGVGIIGSAVGFGSSRIRTGRVSIFGTLREDSKIVETGVFGAAGLWQLS